jgi:hypothetical protein
VRMMRTMGDRREGVLSAHCCFWLQYWGMLLLLAAV